MSGMALRQRVGCAFKSQGLDVGCNNLYANGVSHVWGKYPKDIPPLCKKENGKLIIKMSKDRGIC